MAHSGTGIHEPRLCQAGNGITSDELTNKYLLPKTLRLTPYALSLMPYALRLSPKFRALRLLKRQLNNKHRTRTRVALRPYTPFMAFDDLTRNIETKTTPWF